jgi:hypothetical protein
MARVLIIGAGIGGLTTAIGIDRSGIEAVVLEQAPELREIGSAISLWPNALKALAIRSVGSPSKKAAAACGHGAVQYYLKSICASWAANLEISPWYCGVQSCFRYCATPLSVRRYAWGALCRF